MSYAPSVPVFDSDSLIARTPVEEPEEELKMQLRWFEWFFCVVAVAMVLAYMWWQNFSP